MTIPPGAALTVVIVGSGGTTAVVLAAGAAGTGILAEALDEAPCRAERVTITSVIAVLSGGVGGAFSEAGFTVGEVITELGMQGVGQLEIKC